MTARSPQAERRRARWALAGWITLILVLLAAGPLGLFAAQVLAHYGVIGR